MPTSGSGDGNIDPNDSASAGNWVNRRGPRQGHGSRGLEE